MNDFEKQWAVALQKSKQKSNTKKLPIETRKKQVTEEMEHFKSLLKDALQQKDKTTIKKILETLFKLRAKQMQIAIDTYEEKYGKPTTFFMERQLTKYYYDCHTLDLKIKKIIK